MRRLALGALLLASGCVGFSNLQRADVLADGHTRIGIAPLALQASPLDDPMPAAPVVLTIDHGVGEHFQLGGRLWLVGGGVRAKYQLIKSAPFVASIGAEASAFAFSTQRNDELAFDFALPILAGLDLDEHQLVFGPRLVVRRWNFGNAGNQDVYSIFPTAVAGLDLAMSDGFHLMPEMTLGWWPGGQELFWTATVGFYFDGDAS